jgi:hypothetical protein
MDVHTFEHAVCFTTKFKAYEIRGMLSTIHLRETKIYRTITVLVVVLSHAEKEKEQVQAVKIWPYDERHKNKLKKTVYERHNIHRSPDIRMIESRSMI